MRDCVKALRASEINIRNRENRSVYKYYGYTQLRMLYCKAGKIMF